MTFKNQRDNDRGEGKDGGRAKGKETERDSKVIDEKDAKEIGDIGGGSGVVASPTTALTSVTSPTTRTTAEDKIHVSPTHDNSSSSTTTTTNSTIAPIAVAAASSSSGVRIAKGAGGGSGMLSSVERKKLALVTKNRRNSWSGKSPVKNPYGSSTPGTPGVLSPQPSGNLASSNGTTTAVSSSLSSNFSPDGLLPGVDSGSIERGMVYLSASIDAYDHKKDHDDGTVDRNEWNDQSAAMQRRVKANRRRSAPLFAHYDGGFDDNDDDDEEEEERSPFGDSMRGRKGRSERGERDDPENNDLLSTAGDVSSLFSPYVSRTIEANDRSNSSSKNSDKNTVGVGDGDGAVSRHPDAKHGVGDDSVDSNSHSASGDGHHPNLIAMQDGKSFRRHRRDDKPNTDNDNENDRSTDKNMNTSSPKRNSGNSSSFRRRHESHEKIQDSKETSSRGDNPSNVALLLQVNKDSNSNSNSIRRGAVQVSSPVKHPNVNDGEPNSTLPTTTTSPPSTGTGEYTISYSLGDLTGNLSTLRQFTTVRKFHNATIKLGVRNPSRRGKHGERIPLGSTHIVIA